jgi:hypothetical protein
MAASVLANVCAVESGVEAKVAALRQATGDKDMLVDLLNDWLTRRGIRPFVRSPVRDLIGEAIRALPMTSYVTAESLNKIFKRDTDPNEYLVEVGKEFWSMRQAIETLGQFRNIMGEVFEIVPQPQRGRWLEFKRIVDKMRAQFNGLAAGPCDATVCSFLSRAISVFEGLIQGLVTTRRVSSVE